MIDTREFETTSWPEIDWLSPTAYVHVDPPDGWYASMKPAFDVVLAALLLIPALPIIVLAWLAVRLSSAGPGFYCQTRAGRGGRCYRIIKLRTMRHNCELRSGIQWAQKGDSRVTRVGQFLRTTHLDELPQLFNVLRGEMSLVGPRPERPEVIRTKGLGDHIPGYWHRLNVRPGVTGFAQLQVPADSDLTSVRHKVVYDIYYIGHQNVWLDVRLIAATLLKTIGTNPEWLRRLFVLPTREAVAESFLNNLTPPPPPEPASSSRLQPA